MNSPQYLSVYEVIRYVSAARTKGQTITFCGLIFVTSRIIKVPVKSMSLGLRLQLITPTLTLIILDVTETSSNSCLQHQK